MKNLRVMFIASIFMSLFISLVSCNNDEVYAELVQDSVIDEEVVEEEIVEETPTPEPEPEPEPEQELEPETQYELKAFYSAEGAGAYTTGGRGGAVLHVTTLADTGLEGSLRWALLQNYARTIVFDVSGEFIMNTYVDIIHGNLTIAGQTAPEGGVSIKGATWGFDKDIDNVIIRYIRLRGDRDLGGTNYSQLIFWGGTNVILDHVSVTYGRDETVLIWADANSPSSVGPFTVQRTIIGEGKTGVILGAEQTNPTDAAKAGHYSFHKNLIAHARHRTPNVAGDAHAEIVNNVIYNWYTRLTRTENHARINHIGNYYKMGPITSSYINEANVLTKTQQLNLIRSSAQNPTVNSVKVYTENNVYEDLPTLTNENWNAWSITDQSNYVLETQEPEANYRVNTPFKINGSAIKILSAKQTYDTVVSDVGANAYLDANGKKNIYIDGIDGDYINDVKNGVYANQTRVDHWFYAWEKEQKATMYYPVIPNNSRPSNYDTDKDGMPDAWEVAKGFNPNADDSSADADGDGYTNLEEFLNLVDL